MVIENAEAVASFFPTTNEVVRAVQFVRENPAVVLGVVVGITSLSVARYYDDERDEIETEEQAVQAAPDQDEGGQDAQATSPVSAQPARKMTRSSKSSVLSISGVESSITETTSMGTIDAGEMAERRESHNHGMNSTCDKMHKNCSFCNQAKETPEACCDPDWGWFIPTCPEDEHPERCRRPEDAHAA